MKKNTFEATLRQAIKHPTGQKTAPVVVPIIIRTNFLLGLRCQGISVDKLVENKNPDMGAKSEETA